MANMKRNGGAGFDVEAPRDLELDDDHRQRNGLQRLKPDGKEKRTDTSNYTKRIKSNISSALITYSTSCMLADCYRTSDPVSGRRNYTYRDAVKSNLGKTQVWLCGFCQCGNLFGTSIGYTITASISAAAVMKANCFHKKGHNADCSVSNSMYMMGFGVIQIFLSQLPNFHDLWWLSIVASLMSFAYSPIAVGPVLLKSSLDAEITSSREQDHEEGQLCRGLDHHNILHPLWLPWICRIRKPYPREHTHRL